MNNSSYYEQIANRREQYASQLSDDEIILRMALNILKNGVLDPEMKFHVLLGSISSLSRIYHAIKIAFHRMFISPHEYYHLLKLFSRYQSRL